MRQYIGENRNKRRTGTKKRLEDNVNRAREALRQQSGLNLHSNSLFRFPYFLPNAPFLLWGLLALMWIVCCIFQALLSKIKALNNFPMAIPPPTPDKYLHNIVWLENKDFLIEFFKVKILSYFLTAGYSHCCWVFTYTALRRLRLITRWLSCSFFCKVFPGHPRHCRVVFLDFSRTSCPSLSPMSLSHRTYHSLS